MSRFYDRKFFTKEKMVLEGVDRWVNFIVGQILNIYKNSIYIRRVKKIATQIDKESSFLHKNLTKAVKMMELTLGKRAYVTQIMGAISLYEKNIIQMFTGEGKSITIALAAVLFVKSKRRVHIVTANDYLAYRDFQEFEPFFKACGVSSSCIVEDSTQDERKKAYECDVLYSTSKELVADFLKDLLSRDHKDINSLMIENLKKDSLNLGYFKGFDCVIVDEADAVLVDDAITPFIISTKTENLDFKLAIKKAFDISKRFKKDRDYKTVLEQKSVEFTKDGKDLIRKIENEFGGVWKIDEWREFLIKQSLVAREFFKKDVDYIIEDGKVVIIDNKTGRAMKDRSWSNGLHQAVEAKESLEISDMTTTLAKISFQRFFRYYETICGMSGTLQGLKDEIWQIYGVTVVKIPHRVPSKMKTLKEKIFKTKKEKYEYLIDFIIEKNRQNIPVLVGVNSIKESMEVSSMLKKVGIKHNLLNAQNNEKEANIIKNAGKKCAVTVATSMAGRGTDIKVDSEVERIGGLHVILTQKNITKRVDMQFYGRCARGGQKGVATTILSLEDDLVKELRLPKFFLNSLFVFNFLQKLNENRIKKIRYKNLVNDINFEKSLSFSQKS